MNQERRYKLARKLVNLSGNNPNKNESQLAIRKAYDIIYKDYKDGPGYFYFHLFIRVFKPVLHEIPMYKIMLFARDLKCLLRTIGWAFFFIVTFSIVPMIIN